MAAPLWAALDAVCGSSSTSGAIVSSSGCVLATAGGADVARLLAHVPALKRAVAAVRAAAIGMAVAPAQPPQLLATAAAEAAAAGPIASVEAAALQPPVVHVALAGASLRVTEEAGVTLILFDGCG